MAVVSSQNAYSVGRGGVYTKALTLVNAVISASIYSSRAFQGYQNMIGNFIGVYSGRTIPGYTDMTGGLVEVLAKVLPTGTGIDTNSTHLLKSVLNGGTIGNLSFDAKYIAAGPISEPIRPLYGILWPKGYK